MPDQEVLLKPKPAENQSKKGMNEERSRGEKLKRAELEKGESEFQKSSKQPVRPSLLPLLLPIPQHTQTRKTIRPSSDSAGKEEKDGLQSSPLFTQKPRKFKTAKHQDETSTIIFRVHSRTTALNSKKRKIHATTLPMRTAAGTALRGKCKYQCPSAKRRAAQG
ncbi:hypothetical protein K505DRAFT_413817 [Melanomma pulvis-pyrius CBS 109.77]|uniref:Uncharacterized protein n=1 Tax=Melanomma pulvis-pyrius CBS 109.77 TaxID=1314802 RepID=A0A6A6XRN0_9PLEO|nr:hypothetical protein K505DRAFT_413817 [Melanomma pulvis-pyrius CBS 109.77]